MLFRLLCASAVAFVLAAAPIEWSRFRGPNASGIADGAALPSRLDPATNLAWSTPVPPGSSSPALTEDRIFLTAHEGDELLTLGLDRKTGRLLWRRSIRRERDERKHKLNNAASSSPVTDGENVYAFFGDFGVVSYGSDGAERWRRPLGPFSNLHGMASSPILADGKLILLADHDVDAWLAALDKDSGETIWKTERPEVVHGFATPTLFEPADDVPQLIVPGSYQLASYDLETGKKLWWTTGVTWQVKPTAVVDDDTVYMTAWAPGADAGKRRFFPPFEEVVKTADADGDNKLLPDEIPEEMRHTGSWQAIDLDHDGYMDARDWSFYRARWSSRNVTLAVRPEGGRGDLTKTRVLWDYERAVPVVSSPLLYRGVLHTVKDGGIWTAIDAASGEVKRQWRLPDAVDKYYSSPVAGDGKIYIVSETGKASVLTAEEGWETLATADLGEPVYATPAIADGMIYVRTETKVLAFR